MTNSAKMQIIKRYFSALEQGDLEAVVDVFAPEMVQIEHPNQLKPAGDKRNVAALINDSRRGARLLKWQQYKILSMIEQGDFLALEVFWEGELGVELGEGHPGDKMRTFSAMFFTFSEARIMRQVNYDCFPAH